LFPVDFHQSFVLAKIFYKNINPIVKFYEEKGILVEVNGEQEIEKVKEEILGKMQSK